jgi:CRP/FNR family transcriptional regulator, cyclic AMP receptor protein
VCDDAPEAGAKLGGAVDPKKLTKVPLFAGLSKKERERVARWADEIDEPTGFHMIDEGRFAYEFFVLLEGTVEVRREDKHLSDLGPGDFFGEVALVEHDRRTATVTATTPVHAIVMLARDFDEMRAEMREVADQIEAAVRERSVK